MSDRRYRGSLAVWALLLAYASLYPFFPLRLPPTEVVAEVFTSPRYVIRSDIALNVAAYVPLGMLACLHFRSLGEGARAIAKAAALGAGFSLLMETLQLFVPNRVTSLVDLASNSLGAVLGALVFMEPIHGILTRQLGAMREGAIIPGAWGDAGLVLAMLWLIAQLNPALPFFGAGDVGGEASFGIAFAHGSAVAMAICGFGLFISALLRRDAGCLRVTLVLLSVALWLKFAAASVVLQPHFSAQWMSGGRIAGLVVGIAALIALRRLGRPVRIYLGLILILAGALLSKIFGAYSPVEELVRLFRWPYGQVGSFATLTRFLHELWPFAAVIFLCGLFLRDRRLSAAARAGASAR